MKFLVDECLSPELTHCAHARGYGESSHVVWLGRGGWKDWALKSLILEGDWKSPGKFVVSAGGDSRSSIPGAFERRYTVYAVHRAYWLYGFEETRKALLLNKVGALLTW